MPDYNKLYNAEAEHNRLMLVVIEELAARCESYKYRIQNAVEAREKAECQAAVADAQLAELEVRIADLEAGED